MGGPIQLGVQFTSTDNGCIAGIRFFKGSQNTGTYTGQLYDLTDNLLASAVFTDETAAGQTYGASYHTASGFYARTANYFTTELPAQPVSKMYAAYSGLVLEIPRLGITMDIVVVPFTENGWDVTWLYRQAGYLNGAAFPTAAGNSVLTAHVWDALNRPGPFYGLKDLAYGDKIIIRAWGKVFTYEVQSSVRLSPHSIAQVMKRESQSWLTLVTCETFDAEKGNYLHRRMVRAVLVSVSGEK